MVPSRVVTSLLVCKRGRDELYDSLTSIEAVPRLRAWGTVDPRRQRPVILPRIGHELHGDPCLPECAVHLQRLAERIGRVALALEQHERRLGVARAGERTLTPRVGHVLPRLAKIPAVVPRAVLGTVLAELIDHRRARHDGLESIGLAFDEAGHLAAIAIADQRE